jgi:mono/diheme cytochrome c family protein
MWRWLAGLAAAGIAGVGAFLIVTRPAHVDPAEVAALTADPVRGEQVFWAGGCASCHAAADATGDARLILAGGRAFKTDFGTFHAPNISSDPVQGIGGWSVADLASAMLHGTSPDGRHYYPAFPYTSYAHVPLQDVADLRAYLATLPASDAAPVANDVPFPFNFRLLVGGWKFLYADKGWVVADPLTPEETRGRALVEGLGHCSECHTPRDALGGKRTDAWLAGGPNPDGPGRIPDITPGALTWSEADIAEYLKSGFTPDYDSAGGNMAEVVQNISHLPDADRAAIAAYLKKVPPVAPEAN